MQARSLSQHRRARRLCNWGDAGKQAVCLFAAYMTLAYVSGLHAQEAVTGQNKRLSGEEIGKTKGHSIFPVLISLGVHAGYDSNSRTSTSGSGSFFTDEQLTLAYDRTRGPLDLHVLAGAGLVERFGVRTDVNASLDLSATYLVSPRLTLKGNVDPAYRVEPDLTSDVGTLGRTGNYFTMNDGLSASYQWSRRFSTVNSYSFRIVRYEDNLIALSTDREEHTIGEEFRFDLFRNTVLVGDYRFLLVNYDSFPRDSITHFALAGVEQPFSSRLKAQLRAGASFRSIEETDYQVNPDFESSLDYALGRASTLSWTTRYSVEQPSGIQTSLSRTTFRTGLQVNYSFTSKISSSFGLTYHHDENESGIPVTGVTAGIPPTPAFSTDAYDILLSLRYQLSRHIDVDVGYQHTEVNSSGQAQQNISGQALQYSRNRYSLGLNFSF